MTAECRIVTAGDAALIVEFSDRIDPVINQQAIALAQVLDGAGLPGVRDVTPTYRSVAIHFDPRRTNYDALIERVRTEASRITPIAYVEPDPIRVPVWYGGEVGPDLGAVAAFAGMTEADVIRLHAARTYRVYMLGFMPGFAYMGTVDERIAAPRLAIPRLHVSAGSVGIAGLQTGIYPASTPGGWQIVGRTPLTPFDLNRDEPFLFKPGDAVQFYAIGPGQYARLQRST